tara:strand:- start:8143 stop:8313 length:171 start_codon:yes stop_codon:yes gene_type:complete
LERIHLAGIGVGVAFSISLFFMIISRMRSAGRKFDSVQDLQTANGAGKAAYSGIDE